MANFAMFGQKPAAFICVNCGQKYGVMDFHQCPVKTSSPTVEDPKDYTGVAKMIRTFESGATRDSAEGKFVYEAFISPVVLRRFAEYMHKNRKQSDGSLRDGDNWQKGFPIASYRDSLIRHVMDAWVEWRTTNDKKKLEELLCAIMFNSMGYLFELLREAPNGNG